MPNQYDLLIKKDQHLVEWDTITVNPHISYLSGAITDKNTVTLTSSGAVSAGYPVILNDNGTVSMPSLTPTTAGSVYTFNTGPAVRSTRYHSVGYDPSSNKSINAYQDGDNASKGAYIVGTISGDVLTFGSEVVFNNTTTYDTSVIYDTANEKIVLSYCGVGYGRTIVGTISGDTFVYGAYATFNAGNNYDNMVSVYDPVSGNVIIAFTDVGNSSYGTAIVGTVSGNSITFGSEVVFNSATTIASIDIACDTINEKIIIAYSDGGNSSYGTAIVGTVSGNSITFGSEVVFNSATTTYTSVTCDNTNGKTVVVYSDGANSGYLTAKVGTVSGDTITFGDPVVIDDTASGNRIDTIYDPSRGKIVVVYYTSGTKIAIGSISGDTIIFDSPSSLGYTVGTFSNINNLAYNSVDENIIIAMNPSSDLYAGLDVILTPSSSTLKTDNFLGIAQSTVTDGQQVRIGLLGYKDANQTGLSINTNYYSDDSGYVATSGKVLLGKTSSATDLIIKG